MACLSSEQLARMALGQRDGAAAAHLKECGLCRAECEKLQSLVEQLTTVHERLNEQHDEVRSHLMTAIAGQGQPIESARPRSRFTAWLGDLTMRQRMSALGGMGVAIVLGLMLLWVGSVATPVSAMEKMAENVRKAQSYQCTETLRFTYHSPAPGEPAFREARRVRYWTASGATRTEDLKRMDEDAPWSDSGPECTDISPPGQPSLAIDHRTQTYQRFPATRENRYSGTFDDLANLGQFAGQASRDLGEKQIAGHTARGFQIDMRQMNPQCPWPGTAEIWIDRQSNWPVLVHYESQKMAYTSSLWISDIQWNVALTPSLFAPTPPAGYRDVTEAPEPLEQQVSWIVKALTIYAEACGVYPSRINSTFNTEELCRRLGLDRPPTPSQRGANQAEEAKAAKVSQAQPGLLRIADLDATNADFAYHGATVGPRDPEKVLLRWKLDEGQYQVLFGDLHAQRVSAEQLRLLEGN